MYDEAAAADRVNWDAQKEAWGDPRRGDPRAPARYAQLVHDSAPIAQRMFGVMDALTAAQRALSLLTSEEELARRLTTAEECAEWIQERS